MKGSYYSMIGFHIIPTMLANITRFPVGVIEKALKIFLELGLIEILDNGAIYMLDIQDFIGKSTTEADRKRNYRKRIEDEKLRLGQMSGQCPDQNYTRDRDRARDRARDRFRDKDRTKDRIRATTKDKYRRCCW